MLSKNKIKYILSLSHKKQRKETGLFVAEGNKLVSDLLPLFPCRLLVCTEEFRNEYPFIRADEIIITSKENIKKVSQLNTPQSVLAVFEQPHYTLSREELGNNLTLVLDTIQDPGNLGTIIRIADWFGIKNVVCSPDTADAFNPKVVQSTMGAIGRVKVHYCVLEAFLEDIRNLPVYGTFLEGESIYDAELSPAGIILMGNEGNGISSGLKKYVTQKIFIPGYPLGTVTSESLNVAVATGITCSEFRRRSGSYVKNH
jgi:TrmH family RNA methyltransferase